MDAGSYRSDFSLRLAAKPPISATQDKRKHMKFCNLGRKAAALVSTLALGACLSSCGSGTIGYIYALGQLTSSGTFGQISGFKIDDRTGNLTNMVGSPYSSGGFNPGNAVVFAGGRYIFVLNKGIPVAAPAGSMPDQCRRRRHLRVPGRRGRRTHLPAELLQPGHQPGLDLRRLQWPLSLRARPGRHHAYRQWPHAMQHRRDQRQPSASPKLSAGWRHHHILCGVGYRPSHAGSEPADP